MPQRSGRSRAAHSRFFLCSRLALTARGHRPHPPASSHCLAPPPPLLSLLLPPLPASQGTLPLPPPFAAGLHKECAAAGVWPAATAAAVPRREKPGMEAGEAGLGHSGAGEVRNGGGRGRAGPRRCGRGRAGLRRRGRGRAWRRARPGRATAARARPGMEAGEGAAGGSAGQWNAGRAAGARAAGKGRAGRWLRGQEAGQGDGGGLRLERGIVPAREFFFT